MKRFISIFTAFAIISSLLFSSVFAERGPQAKFKDVKDSDWFAEAVGKMNAQSIIDGMPGGSFNPQGIVTRAQFVKMLVQSMGYQKIDSISFDDLKPFATSKPHWACVYIETALRNEAILKDERDNNFYPDTPLTRKDMGIMMFRALKLQPSSRENPFVDLSEANESLTKLYEEYLIRGTIEGGKRLFKQEGLTTRAEAAVIMARMVEYKENPQEYVTKSAMEERFKNGTYTEEDLAAKAKIELAKQAADKEYIPEPIFKYDYDTFKGLHVRGVLVNTKNYTDDTTFSVVCTDYPDLNKQAHGTARGGFVETDATRKLSAKEAGAVLINIPVFDAKKVSGIVEYYDYGFSKGMKINYVLTITRGKVIRKVVIFVTI